MIHFMRPFAGDDNDDDVVLKVAVDATLYTQVEYSGSKYSGSQTIYLDDPQNPILTGSLKCIAFSVLAIIGSTAATFF